MMPNIDPTKMKSMMKQMGISQQEISAKRVIIERDEENIIIENPSVTKITMQGNDSWQISGDEVYESVKVSDEDVKLVMEKTGADEEKVRETLEKTNDIADAIIELS